jgi:amino acid transporter
MVGLVAIAGVMLFGSHSGFVNGFNRSALDLFGNHNAYANTIATAAKANGGAIVPNLGFSPFFGPSLLLIPFLCFWILWPNWGATLYGEVRGASDFKRVMGGMMWGLWITIAIAIVFVLLATKFFGWQFFNAANLNYWNIVYGVIPHAPMPVWSYPPLLVGMYFHSSFLTTLIILVFGAWFIGWAGTLFLSSTRVIFAAAFDRILPEKVADVSERRHVPTWALVLMLVPSVVVSAFYAYTSKFATFILDATLVIAVTFFGTAIAAIILPWRKKELFKNSPIARYKVLGIPLITLAGLLTAAFLGWNLYQWFSSSLYAVNNKQSLVFMGAMYALAVIVYIVARIVRSRQGINLKAIYEEIPVD